MAALCYADKFVTERTDDVSEVLIEDSNGVKRVQKPAKFISIATTLKIYK